MQETWKDIKDYEGFFQVSNLGRIKSLKRECEYYNGHTDVRRVVNEKIRKQQISPKGYLSVTLSNGNIRKKYQVHRLVANAFIPNIENKKEINHKNGLKTDNRVENLEWNTRKENVIHSFEILKRKRFLGKENHLSKEVIQYDLQMKEIARFGSAREAERITGYPSRSITACCRGEHRTTHGYIWKYKEE